MGPAELCPFNNQGFRRTTVKRFTPWLLASTSLMWGIGAATVASAQSNAFLEEIVISARKIEESLQDAPITVNARTRAALDRQGVTNIGQLSNVIPGLSYDQDFGRRLDRPAIRGQSSILGTPNAASFLDGVFIPDSLFGPEMAFVERIEVIKGPQAALYGRQTFSGAISYVSRRPSNELEGQVRVTAATRDEFDILGTISAPVIEDKLFIQAGFNYYTYGGTYRNNNPTDDYFGVKVGDEETKAGSLMALFTPNENLEVTLRYAYGKNDDGQDATGLQRASKNNCFPDPVTSTPRYYCGAVDIDPEDIALNLDEVQGGRLTRSTHRAAAIIKYDLNGYELASVSGYTKSDERRRADLDFLPVRTIGGSLHARDDNLIEAYSQEFRVTSPTTERFRWLGGVYYYHEDRDTGRHRFVANTYQDNGTNTIRNYAAFGMVQFDLTDDLTAGAELRYAEDKLGLVGGDNNYDLSVKFKSWNPRFTLNYRVNDDVMLYGIAARGNKPGGFNSDARLSGDQVWYDEETAWSYEVGVKSDLFDNRLRLNLAAYWIEGSDQQLTQVALFGADSISYIDNVGSLRSKGVEAEVTGAVTDWWTLQVNGSYTKATYQEGTDDEVGRLTGNPSLVGKYAPNTPKYQLAVISDMNMELADGWTGFLNASFTYRSKKFDQVGNFAWIEGREVVDARVGVENDTYSFTMFVRNLFDNRDPVGVIRYVDFATAGNPRGFQVGLPRGRQFGITVDAKF